MVASKKRITTELLHIALVITLLRDNPRHVRLYDNVLSSNFFNDVDNYANIDNILVEGPNWAFSRTNYHRLGMYIDPGIVHTKSLSGNFRSYNDDYYDTLDSDSDHDGLNLEEEIYRQQSRLILLSNLNAAYVRKDPIQTFRDITAYLVSDTTTENLPNSLAGLPIVPPASSSGSSSGPTGNTSPTPSGADSGNDSGDSGDESGRHSFSESEPDLSGDKCEDSLFEIFESDVQSECPLLTEPLEVVPESSQEDIDGLNNHEVPFLNHLSSDLNADLDVNNLDATEFLDFIINNHNEDDAEDLGAASLPLLAQPSTRLSQVLENNGLLGQSMVSELFELPTSFSNGVNNQDDAVEMEWTLAEEEANLDFYKNFNDAANDMMRTVSIREVEGGLSPIPEVSISPHTAQDDESRSQAGAANIITLEDVIDDWLETDSGVFDFLGSPTSLSEERNTLDFNSIPSVGSVESDSIDLEFDGDQGTSPSPSRANDENSVDMIQAAPTIHSNNNGRPTPHPAQPRGFQVHARMPGLLRGGSSMDQRWNDVVTFLNLQQGGGGPHDGSNGPLPPSLSHPFGPHLHHHGAPLHHHHHHHHFSAPPPTAPYNTDTARSVLLQNATLPPPDVSSPYSGVSMGPPPNIGSAVASSMHLTNSSDPMIDPSSHYKMIEHSHDMIYYPNGTTNAEMNNQSTTDGLFSTVEDELQFMEMSALNEGLHQMRMLDYGVGSAISHSLEGAAAIPHGPQQSLPNGCSAIAMTSAEDRLEASSDSAVSSMGSERVPPMTDPSDSEWVDSHPHSHDSSPYSLDYSGVKGRGYDYYGKDRVPVAQKKHHMFGKRFQQEQGPYALPPHHHPGSSMPYPSSSGLHSSPSLDSMDLKYGCGVEFARHQNDLRTNGGLGLDSVHNNHTYALPPTHGDNALTSTFKAPKPPVKDKQSKMSEDLDRFAEDSSSRDDKRARAMNLPITTEDIINLPMDEFNERLSKFDLSEPQLSLIRDIRRRGKNKVAAQNCRKRKLDQIMQLADEVQRIRERKQSLLREQQELSVRRHDLTERYRRLYRHIFQALRDPDGNPYSIYDYNLEQAADGNIMLVQRNPSHPSTSAENIPSIQPRRDKSKDDYNKKAE